LLPLWVAALLLAIAVAAVLRASVLRRELEALRLRLASRERGEHFLGESPDVREILRHAYAATEEILALKKFDLYRIGGAGTVEEAWKIRRPLAGVAPEPVLEPEHPLLGLAVDPARLLALTATETERSFAPRDLLAGGPDPRRLRLPLYSGDRLIAYLDLEAEEVIDAAPRAEIRALLPALTASLHALRNWTIAVTDELSGLSSRRYFEARLAEEWSRFERYGGSLAVACFDLDRFKTVNDSFGHGAGDEAIRRFGRIVRAAVRSSDVACRYGGEEFAILFPESRTSAALAVAERVRRSFASERFETGGRSFRVTVSAGVAAAPDAPTREQLVFRADEALYAAKRRGRNRVREWETPPAAETPASE
jgi:diguanylate cyclase (GGDEF)-like protein